jgi:glycosyltransferase involved in cell wall biosynthesis
VGGRLTRTSSSPRPTVLCLVDKPLWAHCRKTDALAKALDDRYDIVKRYQAEVTAADIERSDLVLLYYWLQVDRLGVLREVLERKRDRLLIGICSHSELSGARRDDGLATLRALPRTVFANSRLLCDEFQPLLGRAIHFTPNGVDTILFRPPPVDERGRQHRPLRVGWAGSLMNHGAEHRGVHEFIAPAVARVPDAELHLAVREERWRAHAEMVDFYRSIDAYVCASRNEGTPNPCLEAAACGVPVITTRVGNMPDFIRDGENGFLVERDIADIASKLARLTDPDARASLGAAARTTALAWDWRLQASRYDAMFRNTLEPISPRP